MEPNIIRAENLKENDFGDTKVMDIFNFSKFNIAKVRKIGNDVKLGYDKKVMYYTMFWMEKVIVL